MPDLTNQGIWPAFWALGNNSNSGVPWPVAGEIDILEDWSPQVFNGAGDTGENSTIHTELTGGDGLSGRFPFFPPERQSEQALPRLCRIIWSADKIQDSMWTTQPEAFFTTTPPAPAFCPPQEMCGAFQSTDFILLNEAISGTLGGSAANRPTGPMRVDYVNAGTRRHKKLRVLKTPGLPRVPSGCPIPCTSFMRSAVGTSHRRRPHERVITAYR